METIPMPDGLTGQGYIIFAFVVGVLSAIIFMLIRRGPDPVLRQLVTGLFKRLDTTNKKLSDINGGIEAMRSDFRLLTSHGARTAERVEMLEEGQDDMMDLLRENTQTRIKREDVWSRKADRQQRRSEYPPNGAERDTPTTTRPDLPQSIVREREGRR